MNPDVPSTSAWGPYPYFSRRATEWRNPAVMGQDRHDHDRSSLACVLRYEDDDVEVVTPRGLNRYTVDAKGCIDMAVNGGQVHTRSSTSRVCGGRSGRLHPDDQRRRPRPTGLREEGAAVASGTVVFAATGWRLGSLEASSRASRLTRQVLLREHGAVPRRPGRAR